MTYTASRFDNKKLESLIHSVSQGDRDALAQLYRSTGPVVYAYAYSILKNTQDAEDVLHDCFVTLWDSAGSYRSMGKPMAWIMTITRNHCLMLKRKNNRVIPLDPADIPVHISDDPQDRIMLRQIMNILSTEERQIVFLHAVAGCKFRQIAQTLDKKTATVLSIYYRAIRKLRGSL